MPILHFQTTGQRQAPDGSMVDLPPSFVLINRGPVVQVSITVSQAIASQLLQAGRTVPTPLSGLALIDTGASNTCIDEVIAQQLQLPVVNQVQMASASHSSTNANVYPARIEIVGVNINIDPAECIGAALGTQGLIALIGRDVLQHCTLFYNGLTGEITLAI